MSTLFHSQYARGLLMGNPLFDKGIKNKDREGEVRVLAEVGGERSVMRLLNKGSNLY